MGIIIGLLRDWRVWLLGIAAVAMFLIARNSEKVSIKINVKNTIIVVIYLLAYMINMHFYYTGKFSARTYLIMPIAIAGWAFVATGCTSAYRDIKHEMPFVSKYTIVSVLIFIVLFLYTLFSYSAQGLIGTLLGGGYYFAILLVFPIIGYMIRKGSVDSFLDIFDILSLIWILMVVMQSILYARGSQIIPEYLDTQIKFRDNSLRITLFYGNFAIIHSFYKLYSCKVNTLKKLPYVCICVFGLYGCFFVQLTRSYTLIVCVCLFIIVLLDKNTSQYKFLRKLLLVIVAVAFILNTGIVSRFISSLSATGAYAGSTYARTYSIAYYWETFKSHFPFGFAFAYEGNYYSLIHGRGIAYIDDVGIFGQLARLGVFILPIYLWLTVRLIKIWRRIKKGGLQKDYVFLSAVLVYFLLTSISLICLDPQRILLYPMIIAIYEYTYYEYRLSISTRGNVA